tara:strand:- start:13 stop:675 length:663 start_codon:yes stop_codon:yes gene_type:complete
MSFKNKKYEVVKKAISYELANFIFNYFLMDRQVTAFMLQNNMVRDGNPLIGTWKDQQIPNTYARYSDQVMETLMMKVLPLISKITGLNLIPTYSYARLYKQRDKLVRHRDRPSCEVSTTLHLGGDPWPIFIDPTGRSGILKSFGENKVKLKKRPPKGVPVTLDVGDMMIYSGCDLEHWRKPFKGTVCGQVFLHYNNVNGPFALMNKFDKRPMLGLPRLNR